MRRLKAVLAVLYCSVASAGALAEDRRYVPYADIERGMDSMSYLALRIKNGAGGKVTCIAGLAHWYSAPLGDMAPMGHIDVSLWHNPANGEIALLNELRDRMPVEAIWCTREATGARARVDLVFKAGSVPSNIAFTCVDARDMRLVCIAMERWTVHGFTCPDVSLEAP